MSIKITKHNKYTTQSGHTLIEVLVVIVILGLFAIPFLIILARLNQHFTKLSLVSQGMYYSQRNLEITTNLVQEDWTIVKDLTKNQPYHLERTAGGWTFTNGSGQTGPYSSSITFTNVCRNAQKNITECTSGALEDPNALKATSTTTWQYRNQTQTSTLDTIFTYIF